MASTGPLVDRPVHRHVRSRLGCVMPALTPCSPSHRYLDVAAEDRNWRASAEMF